MIKRVCVCLAVLGLLLTICSCSNHSVGRVLDDIECFILERPDSALTLLESVDKDALCSKSLRAKYALLFVTALDKNYIDTTDLSLIEPAVDYYTKHGSAQNRMKSLFYRGCIHLNRNEDNKALHYFLLALEDSAKVKDNRYKGLVNSAISDVYSRNYNFEQQLSYAAAALDYSRMAGYDFAVWNLTASIASAYGNLKQWEDAEMYYDKFFSLPVYDSLLFCNQKINYVKDIIFSPNPDYKKCINIIEDVLHSQPEFMTAEAYCYYAYASQKLGDDEVASSIMKQLESFDSKKEVIGYWRYNISKNQGDFKQALFDLEHSVLMQDSVVNSILRESLMLTQRDYYQASNKVLKTEKELARSRMVIVVFLVLVLFILWLLYDFRRRASFNKKMETLSSLHRETQSMLNLQLEEKGTALLELRKRFAQIYRVQYKSLNDLCSAYFSPVKKDKKEILYNEAMRQLDVIVGDTDSQDHFVNLVNTSIDGIIDKLRHDLPKHKEQDFRFLAFVIVGFDAATISNLTGLSVGSVYTKKNRIKNEISKLDSPDKDFYLPFLD